MAKRKPRRRKSVPRAGKPKRNPVKEARAETPPRYMDQRFREFGEEVGKLGERFGERMEKRGKEWESSWNRTFGVAGPFISSIFGLIVLAAVLWIFGLVNLPLGSAFLNSVYDFMFSNLAVFFAFFLFFSYTSYFSKRYRGAYIPVSPIVIALGITIGFWLVMSAIFLINVSLANAYLTQIGLFIQYNLLGIFIAFMLLGYLVIFVKAITGSLEVPGLPEYREGLRMVRERPAARRAPEVKRLYRSGRDKILGGVCGGIAEYLGVDPVLIRLIWVIAALAWGAGIIAYIIAWIIIPRNPGDRWD
jgi:phage shock protein PspC (stress-responsive transcriptional regulator)